MTSDGKKSRNNIDKYLHDLFKNEIKLHVSDEEVNGIQKSLETIVFRIIAHIANCEPRLSVNTDDVLKVGSFYEGTKICYPDEFDFLVRFDCLGDDEDVDSVKLKDYVKRVKQYPWYLTRAVDELNSDASHTCVETPSGLLKLDASHTPEEHGPAIKLRLLYTNKAEGNEQKHIYVDITAAVKLQGIPTYMEEDDDDLDIHFKEMAQKHQSHLLVFNKNQDIPIIETFTEVEMHFIKKVLSDHHRKVFMILKYLVNGKHTIEQDKGHVFSSYAMKTMMFYHHYTCPGSCELSTCVLIVLESINEQLKRALSNVSAAAMRRPITIWQNVFTGRSFSKKVGKEVKKCSTHLKQLIDDLEKKIGQMPSYSYRDCAVKPLIDY